MANSTTSLNTKLSYKTGEGSYTELLQLQEIPALGGSADSIEITTLADKAHVYTDGLLNYGDTLGFKFLYEQTQFETLAALDGTQSWMVTLPDGMTCAFDGTCSVQLDGIGIGAVYTYTLNIKPSSEMVWA